MGTMSRRRVKSGAKAKSEREAKRRNTSDRRAEPEERTELGKKVWSRVKLLHKKFDLLKFIKQSDEEMRSTLREQPRAQSGRWHPERKPGGSGLTQYAGRVFQTDKERENLTELVEIDGTMQVGVVSTIPLPIPIATYLPTCHSLLFI